MANEAEIKENKISFTNGFRVAMVLFTCLWTVIGAITAYAYVIVLPTMTKNIIDNDEKYVSYMTESRIMITENKYNMVSIKDDLEEIKELLKRKIP